MTYGWAILVVLVVIGALAYFGVLSPATLLPEKCTFPVSISCTDHSVTPTYIAVVLQNGAGKDMIIRGVTATGDALGTNQNQLSLCSTKSPTGEAPSPTDTCPVSTGLGVNGCTSPTLTNGASTAVTLKNSKGADNPTECTFVDVGRDKNRYNVTVFYSWLDSPGIMHQLPGEMLARRP